VTHKTELKPAKLVVSPNTRNKGALTLDPGAGWQEVVTEISDFKRKLDHEWNAQKNQRNRPTFNAPSSWLSKQGIVKGSGKDGIAAVNIANWIFGNFWRDRIDYQLCEVPAWMCLNWDRKQYSPLGREEYLKASKYLDEITRTGVMEGNTEPAIGQWLAPLPLVVIRSGNHRVELYNDQGESVLIRLRTSELAPAKSLTVSPVFHCPDLLALTCSDSSFWRNENHTVYLPIRDLAWPILLEYGAHFSCRPAILTPRNKVFRGYRDEKHYDGLSWREEWCPRNWRRMLIAQTYV